MKGREKADKLASLFLSCIFLKETSDKFMICKLDFFQIQGCLI